MRPLSAFVGLVVWLLPWSSRAAGLDLAGLTLTPHQQSTELRYRQDPDRSLGARVQVFVRNNGTDAVRLDASSVITLRGGTATQWLERSAWAWHDFPSAWPQDPLLIPPGAITVWSFNSRGADWGTNTRADIVIPSTNSTSPILQGDLRLESPSVWVSAITAFGRAEEVNPSSLLLHLANESTEPVQLDRVRLWLPDGDWRIFQPGNWQTNFERFPADGRIGPHDRGGVWLRGQHLPLGYAVVETEVHSATQQPFRLWSHIRLRTESFDLSGGWVGDSLHGRSALTYEPYLKTLKRMHLNTAHIGLVPGYTDQPDLYRRYPLKLFNRLDPISYFDTDAWLPRIHAVEFLGEPQYGGGRPVPPMEVWRALSPYQKSRLPTTVTHSEERVWRWYAGLSDFPHFDAYRVTAPAPDAWSKYERWGGSKIRWGAPLETIGDMTRSLRELNRPAPIAVWSQGAHYDWKGQGRPRSSPTADELRAQAYHALSSRITSLYWFNLSLKSLLAFPDLIDPITRVGREIKCLGEYYLEGDATFYQRVSRDGKPEWDLSVIAGPHGALLFALDLTYQPDLQEKVFRFPGRRSAEWNFVLPGYWRGATNLAQVDAEGVRPRAISWKAGQAVVGGDAGPVNVFLLTYDPQRIEAVELKRQALIRTEADYGFNPAGNPQDLEQLQRILSGSP